MGQRVNPGALAGATGATNPSQFYKDCQETLSGNDKNIQQAAQWIESRFSLSQCRARATFSLGSPDGGEQRIELQKRTRQVLETLIAHPIYCASKLRISETVRVLRHDYGVEIETVSFDDYADGEKVTFGIYVLRQHVELLTPELPLEQKGYVQ